VQAFDFIEADFAILIVFEFFLMTAEYAEKGFYQEMVRTLRLCRDYSSSSIGCGCAALCLCGNAIFLAPVAGLCRDA